MHSRYLKKIYYKLPFGIQAKISELIWKPQFGNDVYFGYGPKTYYGQCIFGNGVRISGYSEYSNVNVGNYTVFAEGFRVLFSVHDYNCFTINSGVKENNSKLRDLSIEEKSAIEPSMKMYSETVIGNDVWIGEYVTVKGGVHIGDGAIIGARSVITHDVPAYAIVAGVPATFRKWRFDEKKQKLMENIKWWNWDKDKITQHYTELCMFDENLRDIK